MNDFPWRRQWTKWSAAVDLPPCFISHRIIFIVYNSHLQYTTGPYILCVPQRQYRLFYGTIGRISTVRARHNTPINHTPLSMMCRDNYHITLCIRHDCCYDICHFVHGVIIVRILLIAVISFPCLSLLWSVFSSFFLVFFIANCMEFVSPYSTFSQQTSFSPYHLSPLCCYQWLAKIMRGWL